MVRRRLLEHVEAVIRGVRVGSGVENSRATETLALTILFRNSAERLDGILASFTSPLNVATFRNRTCVL